MNQSYPPPFFIIGSGRSGTTMLRLMLNRHSGLRVPRESWFIMPLLDQLPSSGPFSPEQKEAAFLIIRNHSRWKDWECPDEILEKTIGQLDSPDLAGLVSAVFSHCSGMREGQRWGDKTPKYSMYADRIAALFPEAQFIHMVRDARDVFLSMKMANWFGGTPRRIGNYWNATTGAALKLRNLGPTRYYEVHYENLVSDPEGELRSLCSFLNVSFEPEMLAFHETARHETAPWERVLHAKTTRPPRAEDLQRWKRELSLLQVLCLESVTCSLMRKVDQRPRFGRAWYVPMAVVRLAYRVTEIWLDLLGKVKGRLVLSRTTASEPQEL